MKRQFDYRPLARFRYELRRFLNLTEQTARDAGVEPQQFQALLAIKGLPEQSVPTVGALAERLQIQHHSAVELADRLEAHGLLKRVRNRNDRREVLLRITPRGEGIVRRLALPHRTELRLAGQAILHALKKALAGSADACGSARGSNHRQEIEKRRLKRLLLT